MGMTDDESFDYVKEAFWDKVGTWPDCLPAAQMADESFYRRGLCLPPDRFTAKNHAAIRDRRWQRVFARESNKFAHELEDLWYSDNYPKHLAMGLFADSELPGGPDGDEDDDDDGDSEPVAPVPVLEPASA